MHNRWDGELQQITTLSERVWHPICEGKSNFNEIFCLHGGKISYNEDVKNGSRSKNLPQFNLKSKLYSFIFYMPRKPLLCTNIFTVYHGYL